MNIIIIKIQKYKSYNQYRLKIIEHWKIFEFWQKWKTSRKGLIKSTGKNFFKKKTLKIIFLKTVLKKKK